jgi:hypothetical protein
LRVELRAELGLVEHGLDTLARSANRFAWIATA